LTEEGVLIIQANRFRTQERNREDARERLFEMIRTAAIAPVPRIATRPSRGSRAERVDEKTRRGVVKKLRQTKVSWD
jgi:ribosome-associated protein